MSGARGTKIQNNKGSSGEEYSNQITGFLGKFLDKEQQTISNEKKQITDVNWNMKKRTNLSLEKLKDELVKGLTKYEWFVTGAIDPSIFSDDFEFKDPDVKLKGVREYCEGVNKLFDQTCSRVGVIDVEITDKTKKTITVTWRLEGRVRVGPGIRIKPYIVYTDFKVNDKGLIYFQEDRFSIPGYDILLSALFPFLGPLLAPPAPAVEVLKSQKKSK
jgi:hypothetical protein